MILVAFLLNLNATSICETAQKVIKNKEKPQKFITSGAFYLVTRTGFEPALVAPKNSYNYEKCAENHIIHRKKSEAFQVVAFSVAFSVAKKSFILWTSAFASCSAR